jgi:outer membrane protein TolC
MSDRRRHRHAARLALRLWLWLWLWPCLLPFPTMVPTSSTAVAQDPPGGTGLTEARAVTLAARNNPGLRAALLQLRSAQLEVEGEEDRYAPLLTIDAGLTHTESPFLIMDGTAVSNANDAQAGVAASKHLPWGTDLKLRLGGSWQLSSGDALFSSVTGVRRELGPGYGLNARLSLAQPLLRGAGRDVNEAALHAARARRSSAERSRERVASELLRDVLIAYWELWAANAAIGIEEQSRALAEQQRDEARARVATGSLAPTAVLTFETQVATRAESVLAARTELEARRAELSRRIGLPRATTVAYEPSEPAPPPPGPVPEAAVERALTESALVRERAAAVELAEVQARTASDPLRPRFDLEAYVQAEGLGNDDVGAAATGLAELDAVSAHIGLIYETPLTGTRRETEAARARLGGEIAREELRAAQQSVASEVQVALAQLSAGRERLALAEHTAQIAEQQLRAEQARLASGASTPLAVVLAENELRAARLRVARARVDWAVAGLTLEHLTGRLLARHTLPR